MSMKITSLVTGGAGFIGAHVVNDLIVLKHEVIVLDDLSGGFEENLNAAAILGLDPLQMLNWWIHFSRSMISLMYTI